MAKKLEEYNQKRDFKKTREPVGQAKSTGEALRFVVQKHDASRLHFDFRLEFDGVLWSWAVPKGPSYNPKDKRLAVQVEDHPLDYRNFEGTIPRGEYGGGTVMLFDEGNWIPEGDAQKGMEEGSLKFTLEGDRLKGRWTLIRMKPGESGEDKNWLLIKENDEFVKESDGISKLLTSVRTDRTMEEIAREESDDSQKEASDPPEEKASRESADKTSGSKRKPAEKASEKASEQTSEKPAKKKRAGQMKPDKQPDLSGALPFSELKPMLATLVKKVPSGKEWVHELKLDGYRILAFLEDGKARLMTRNGHDWSHKIPQLAKTLESWAPGNAVFDGELVVMDPKGKSDFQLLQSYFKGTSKGSADYIIFDLLALGNQDLRQKTLLERKELLEELLKDSPAGLHFSPHTEGSEVFDRVCEADMEGIVSKKKDSPYRSARSRDWVKTKCEYRQEFVIGGYTATDQSTTGLSALLLGAYEGQDLIFKGRAGTGFSQAEAADLLKRFKALHRKTSPFTENPKPRSNETITFLKPMLAAEIQFAEITDDGLLRQASFKGLREDKPAAEVSSEFPDDMNSSASQVFDKESEKLMENPDADLNEPKEAGSVVMKQAEFNRAKGKMNVKNINAVKEGAAEDKTKARGKKNQNESPASEPSETKYENKTEATAAAQSGQKESVGSETSRSSMKAPVYGEITLSSPDRVVFPDDAITKKDVADYYWELRKEILPYLTDRPMTLIRCTENVTDCFFQKHMNHSIPGMDEITVPDNDGQAARVMVIRDENSLMGAVQMGTLEFHGWGAGLKKIEQPDWLVFDLDPDEGMNLEQVRQGVRDLKSILDEMELEAFLKTSGGKGYHIVVPLTPSADWEQTRNFARLLAQSLEMKWPDKYTSNMRKEKRKGRIYIDWVRNGRSATSVSIYSLRGRKGAPISWPIAWTDLDDVAPHQVTLKNWKDYRKTIKSWESFFTVRQKIK